MSKPIVVVFLLIMLIVTSQFEWRQQPLVEINAAATTTLSHKQQHISEREEAVKEKIIMSQERHIQRLNELVRSLKLQVLQCKGENETQNATSSYNLNKQFIEVERKQILEG